jgi:hypothetical protein
MEEARGEGGRIWKEARDHRYQFYERGYEDGRKGGTSEE